MIKLLHHYLSIIVNLYIAMTTSGILDYIATIIYIYIYNYIISIYIYIGMIIPNHIAGMDV